MAREDLTSGSRHVFVCMTGSYGSNDAIRMETDRDTAGNVEPPASEQVPAAPRWLRITRKGHSWTTEESPDGQMWKQMSTYTLSLPPIVHVGIAVVSHNEGAATTAVFDNVEIKEINAHAVGSK